MQNLFLKLNSPVPNLFISLYLWVSTLKWNITVILNTKYNLLTLTMLFKNRIKPISKKAKCFRQASYLLDWPPGFILDQTPQRMKGKDFKNNCNGCSLILNGYKNYYHIKNVLDYLSDPVNKPVPRLTDCPQRFFVLFLN
jgi:hypothetical protein